MALTKAQWDAKVLERLKASKGYTTIFAVTDNRYIASAFDRLEKSGKIVRDRSKESGYPTMYFEVIDDVSY